MRGLVAVLGGGGALAVALGLPLSLLGVAATPEPAQAQCSVLSHKPCLPYNYPRYYPCGLSVRPGCMPSILLPLNQVPVIKVEGHTGETEPVDRDHKVSRLDELGP